MGNEEMGNGMEWQRQKRPLRLRCGQGMLIDRLCAALGKRGGGGGGGGGQEGSASTQWKGRPRTNPVFKQRYFATTTTATV
jgi:hypothetical protein